MNELPEIVKEEVKTFVSHMYCPKCGIELSTGKFLLSEPPQYEHVCSICGYTHTDINRYPLITVEKI